ncbi:MAG: FliA/WhiG family RNA polymerase sigma factor [Desulfobulbaceae bacterium]|nr:FliA/WhiG family RNA polymerase sigma factor [Candidatus Kapabacteria bacterium]MBS3999856.1 FliA/WhiG family RNA polymerase sigma factor [Desulfobulbaceae bacterium]
MAELRTNPDEIWVAYFGERNYHEKSKLISHYIWLIKYAIANMPLPSNTILEDQDFMNFGILGLNNAIERFDPNRGVKFESYAIKRIRGIIQDELRKLDWLTRTTRKKAQDLVKASDKIKSREGREATTNEIISLLNITPEKYKSYLQAVADSKASLNANENGNIQFNDDDDDRNDIEEVADSDTTFYELIEEEERSAYIQDYIKSLKENKRIVLTLYYFENLTFKEIGKVLNISESRVCQIHTQIIKDLKEKLIEYDYA